MKRHRVLILLTLLGLSPFCSSIGEEEKKVNTAYTASGTEVPRYYLVGGFFAIADSFCRDSKENKDYFILQIGLDPGSQAEQIFMRAVARARELRYGPRGPLIQSWQSDTNTYDTVEYGNNDVPTRHEGETEQDFVTRVRDRTKERARRLADIYYDLEVELAAEGFPMTGIENYIATELAPATSFASDKPLDSPRPLAVAFEEQLDSRSRGN